MQRSKSHFLVSKTWFYFREKREIEREARTEKQEGWQKKQAVMLLFYGGDMKQKIWHLWIEGRENMYKHRTASSVSLLSSDVSRFMSAVALNTRQRSITAAPSIFQICLVNVAFMCVQLNVQPCGRQSGIRSGSVLLKCEEVQQCNTLCFIVLAHFRSGRVGGKPLHTESPHCCSETAAILCYCRWRLEGSCGWKHQFRTKWQILRWYLFQKLWFHGL